jgi:IS5 family transposase
MYILQIWFNLSDEMLEDCIYDSYSGLAKNEGHLNMLFACVNLVKLIGKIKAEKPLYPQIIG